MKTTIRSQESAVARLHTKKGASIRPWSRSGSDSSSRRFCLPIMSATSRWSLEMLPPSVHVFTAGHPAKATPLRIPISPGDLDPGVYSRQIQVMDEAGKRGVAQSVELMVR